MRMQEQGLGAVVVKVVGVLLLGILGCTRTLEGTPHAKAQAAPVEKAQAASEAQPVAAAPAPAADVAPIVAAPVEIPDEPTLRVHEIRLVEREARTALLVRMSRPIDDVSHFALANPNRVVIDVAGPLSGVATNRSYTVSEHGVARVRVGAHEGKLRLVTDVQGRVPSYEVHGRRPRGRRAPRREQRTGRPDGLRGPRHPPTLDAPVAVAAAAPAPAAAEPVVDTAVAGRPAPVAEPAPAVARGGARPRAHRHRSGGARRPRPEHRRARLGRHGRARRRPRQGETRRRPSPRFRAARSRRCRPRPREYTGQRISLDFKDADIQNVLRVLADVSGLNIIATDDVQGKVTLHLIDVPWDQALDLVLQTQRPRDDARRQRRPRLDRRDA